MSSHLNSPRTGAKSVGFHPYTQGILEFAPQIRPAQICSANFTHPAAPLTTCLRQTVRSAPCLNYSYELLHTSDKKRAPLREPKRPSKVAVRLTVVTAAPNSLTRIPTVLLTAPLAGFALKRKNLWQLPQGSRHKETPPHGAAYSIPPQPSP